MLLHYTCYYCLSVTVTSLYQFYLNEFGSLQVMTPDGPMLKRVIINLTSLALQSSV